MKKTIAIVLVSGLLLTACDRSDEADNSDTGNAPPTSVVEDAAMVQPPVAAPTDAAGYLAMAGAGDLWEIESSKVLLAKSNNADVKKFAQMMVDHHTASTEKVKAAAMAANLSVSPPTLSPDQQRMLDEIKKNSSATVDAVYLRHQNSAHGAALALHKGYAAAGDTESLKKAASEIAPVVQQHIDALGKLSVPR